MASSTSTQEVYFFTTCVVNSFASAAGLGALNVLEKLGFRVHYPMGQTCCGQPAYNAGFPKEAHKVAKAQLNLFPKNIPIVIPSGSCASMIKHHYPQLFLTQDPKMSEHVKAVTKRIVEWNDFIVQTIMPSIMPSQPNSPATPPQFQDKGEPITVILHPSCHSHRELRVSEQAFKLLELLKQVTVIRLPHENECCGFGGLFSVNHPTLSTAMADNKIDEILSACENQGATRLLSNDYSCLLHLAGRLRRRQSKLKVSHIAEFIAERIL